MSNARAYLTKSKVSIKKRQAPAGSGVRGWPPAARKSGGTLFRAAPARVNTPRHPNEIFISSIFTGARGDGSPTHTPAQFTSVCSVQFSSGQSRIPTVTAEWPGCRCLAEPPPVDLLRLDARRDCRRKHPDALPGGPDQGCRGRPRSTSRVSTPPSPLPASSQPPWRCADAVLPPSRVVFCQVCAWDPCRAWALPCAAGP